MKWKLELVPIPVSAVDRAKAFYTEKVGFNQDHDLRVSDQMRVVQLTPPGRPARSSWGWGSSTRHQALSKACTQSSRTSTRRVGSSPSRGGGQ